jgi:hypothetical protein
MQRQAEWKDGVEQTSEGDAEKVVYGVVTAVAASIMLQAFILYFLG